MTRERSSRRQVLLKVGALAGAGGAVALAGCSDPDGDDDGGGGIYGVDDVDPAAVDVAASQRP